MSQKLIAILRGIEPAEAVAVTQELINCGIHTIDVPLNSPEALTSIARMSQQFGDKYQIGAGTVVRADDVLRVRDAGGRFIVSPNCNESVIKQTKAIGMKSYPGVFTASECFDALEWGADALKLFPASVLGPSGVSAIRTVLPKTTQLYAVGGVDTTNMASWIEAGIDGFGIGSSLYKPGRSISEISRVAQEFVAAFSHVTRAV